MITMKIIQLVFQLVTITAVTIFSTPHNDASD